MSGSQLPLQLRFAGGQRFASFEPQDAEALQAVRRLAAGGSERLFLSGPTGSGKTHLLQAACAEAAEHGRQPVYLPLAAFDGQVAEALQAQPAAELLCIDGVDRAAGDAAAELALFALHNRQHDAGGGLLYAARDTPDQLPLGLPDLRSRLQHCTRLTLQPLDEAGRRALLQHRAEARGMQLDDSVLDYLFRHVGRDLATLSTLLERIDRDSLAAKRRITVPFLKGRLGD
jgi:DnaA-homolog protein